MINSVQTPVNLRRYVRALVHLRKDLKHSIHMDTYKGLGDIAVRVYQGIYEGIRQSVNDPDLDALALIEINIPPRDKEKIALVNLLSGQLHIYLESVVDTGDEHDDE